MVDEEFSSQDTANFLQWSGYALIVVCGITTIVDMLPVALLQPVWLVRFSSKLLGGGILALTGMVLLVLALRIDPGVLPLSRFQKRIRIMGRFVALVFLLLIPVQTIAGVVVLDDESRTIQSRLTQLQQATDLISIANNENELINGLALLPQSPISKGQKLSAPFAAVKSQVLRQLNRQIPQLQTRIEEVKKVRLVHGTTQWFKQAVISAAYAMAFWTLGSVRTQSRAGLRHHPLQLAFSSIPMLRNLRLGRRNRMEIPAEWLESSGPADHRGGS